MPYKDKEKQRAFQKSWQRERVERLRKLKDNPCKDCGNKFHPAAMQWDHLNGTTKFKELSRMSQYSWERQLEEIAKCELVCANCHAIRTFNRSNSPSTLS